MKLLFLFFGSFLLVVPYSFARSTEERIGQLEQKITAQESSELDRNSNVASAMARMDRIESQLQSVGGGTESQMIQMQQMRQSIERLYRDLEMRLAAAENQMKLFQSELSRALSKVAPGLEKERMAFQKGLDQVQMGQYAAAITAFQQFMKQYPKSSYVTDALFWIAECRASTRDFQQSIQDYQKVVERFPKSDKAPLAILKQGDAFLNLEMKSEAKIFWNKLVREYPKSVEAAQARSKVEALEKNGAPQATAPITPLGSNPPAAPAPETASPPIPPSIPPKSDTSPPEIF